MTGLLHSFMDFSSYFFLPSFLLSIPQQVTFNFSKRYYSYYYQERLVILPESDIWRNPTSCLVHLALTQPCLLLARAVLQGSLSTWNPTRCYSKMENRFLKIINSNKMDEWFQKALLGWMKVFRDIKPKLLRVVL